MNITQMKSAIKKFRSADVSVIKDDALRAKAQKLQGKQSGFTLLELLVVITLLATLATAALVAYENVGENAEAVAAANNAVTIDRALRQYRAVENEWPDQWDNLTTVSAATALPFAPPAMQDFTAAWTLDASAAQVVAQVLVGGGVEELQFASTLNAGVEPNRGHNESANPGSAVQVVLVDANNNPDGTQLVGSSIAVVPTAACNATNFPGYANPGASANPLPTATFSGTPVIPANTNDLQNSYADILEADACHLVVALGFGGDAASSTSFSRVGIPQSPAYLNAETVNPADNYSRFIGLFHFAEYDDVAGEWDLRESPRLLSIVSTDGERIDEMVAAANSTE
ncbi:MAG: prepilin-type N-terminal cleavage/methylation domain-containing protein [Gammaproteobacteria bacterium]|nr:prepilin-type N-terminal cleavage/methylation domain-containing protein [Gammaproteobacteria bacterium]